MSTLLFTRSEIENLIEPEHLQPALRSALLENSRQIRRPEQRVRATVSEQGTAMILFPGLLASIPAYTVKVHAKYPKQVPSITGVVLLHDLCTGALLSVLDSGYLTAVRTALVATLATDALSRKESSTLAIFGTGVQADFLVHFLLKTRQIRKIVLFDLDTAKAISFASKLRLQHDAEVLIANSPTEAAHSADIIVTATWATTPFLSRSMVKVGTHITVLGSDEPGKNEVSVDLLCDSLVYCDHRLLNLQMGAVGNAGLGSERIFAEIGEVFEDPRKGRTHAEQITLYTGVGLPVFDLVTAFHVYQQAQKRGIGTIIDFVQ